MLGGPLVTSPSLLGLDPDPGRLKSPPNDQQNDVPGPPMGSLWGVEIRAPPPQRL